MLRYERKYRIEDVSLSTVLQVIRLHPASLRQLYPNRQINNIYFDTPGLTTYKENVMGISTRKKYRVRWYGDDPLVVKKPLLEIKNRNNEVGNKDIFKVEEFSFERLQPLIKQVNNLCQPLILEPVLQNSYKRAYFGTSDKKFRITVDWDLSYASMRNTNIFRKHHQFEPKIIVLEIKYDKDLENEANRISQYFPFRRTKNSKYVSGVELCW